VDLRSIRKRGARALADEASPNLTASLTVNGLSAGQSGDRL